MLQVPCRTARAPKHAPSRRTPTRTRCEQTAGTAPPRTCSEAAAQARRALRRFRGRDVGAAGELPAPIRLTVRLPLPSPAYGDDLLRNYDEGDWPGGVVQRFRAVRPLVDALLEGYQPQFVGMLESPADGVGVWRAAGGDATVVAGVGNATFAPFARLCAGEFGGGVRRPGHLLLAVNHSWTSSADIGQFWDRGLKAQAADLIDDPTRWEALYHAEDVRTAAGATGLLLRAWPGGWRLYDTSGGEPHSLGACLLESPARPGRADAIRLLNEAWAQRRQAARRPGGWLR